MTCLRIFFNITFTITRHPSPQRPTSHTKKRIIIMPGSSGSLFVYGTLMSPQVLRVLIGRLPETIDPATIVGYTRHPVQGQSFPGMIPSPSTSSVTSKNNRVTGVVLKGLTDVEMKVLDWFEGDEYSRTNVHVYCDNNSDAMEQSTQTYVWSNPISELDTAAEWSYEYFRDNLVHKYLLETVTPCRKQLDELNIGTFDQ